MIMQGAVVALMTKDTIYSQAIPANATNLKFQIRQGASILLYSWDNFSTYFTVPIPAAGAAANNTGVVKMGANWRCSPNGQTLYVKDHSNSSTNLEVEWAIDG